MVSGHSCLPVTLSMYYHHRSKYTKDEKKSVSNVNIFLSISLIILFWVPITIFWTPQQITHGIRHALGWGFPNAHKIIFWLRNNKKVIFNYAHLSRGVYNPVWIQKNYFSFKLHLQIFRWPAKYWYILFWTNGMSDISRWTSVEWGEFLWYWSPVFGLGLVYNEWHLRLMINGM